MKIARALPGFLAQRKTDAIAVVDVLQDLTTRIPDDTWLERFTVDSSGRIGIQGQSAKAAPLIDVLQSSKLITGANFQGVIQRDPQTNKERFYMDAQLRKPNSAQACGEQQRQERRDESPADEASGKPLAAIGLLVLVLVLGVFPLAALVVRGTAARYR